MDVSDENMVMVLAKDDDSSDKEWKDFTLGLKGAQPSVSPSLTNYFVCNQCVFMS